MIETESLDGDSSRVLSMASNVRMYFAEGRVAYFETCNRNKRSTAVILKTKKVRETGYTLVEEADGLFRISEQVSLSV